MHKLLLIIKREFLTKVRSKAYLVLIFLSPLLMLGMFSAIFYFASKEESLKDDEIKILSVTSSKIHAEICENHPLIKFEKVNSISFKSAKELVADTAYNGIIYTDASLNTLEVYGDENIPFQSIGSILEKYKRQSLLKEQTINSSLIDQITNTELVHITLKKESENDIKTWVKGTIAVGTGYLVMMFVIIYGNSVMRSIIEEKNSRVIEIMICTVKPFQLLLGKIIGNALAGILQFTIWGVLLLVGLFFIEANFPSNGVESAKIAQIFTVIWDLNYLEIFVSFVCFFLSGYLLYSSFYASVGAAVNSETDTQQFVHPILLPLMFAVYIGIVTVVNGHPNGSTATLFSLIPFTSPIVMLMRIPYGVPMSEIILSLALLLVSFITTVYIASKIYRIGILTYGNKPSIKQLVKWMFQK